ncbi:putative bifunctional diguanylate cyclase/phosphodiesterase [Roseibium salinum]|uniref:EAL domain-containing protein n=2 Tax=Roseibium salinum TaxID=1604349 RepID=A0ABT3R317_9HYPH|nr:EAL domain-containing protein [Roseibium sp. DSM 29163]MCX2723485.1 EAL domain-containing protein [Roseibium sp. DSM 29163]
MLFENFRWFPHMADSIEAWRNAEVYLHELEKLAGSIGDPAGLTPSRRAHLLATLDRLDVQISPLAREFSDSLGEGSRVVQGLLLGANLLLAAVFIALTIWRLNSFLKHRRSIEGKLSWSANHDALTGLPNRRLFERSLRETLRSGDTQHAVIFLDLDQFKTINDTGGHAVGDHLLNGVAGELTAALPPTALLARLGGDEFGLVLPDCPHEEAQATAHRLRKIVETFDFSWEGLRYAVTASIGVVLLGDRIFSFTETLRAADVACYIAKEKGRNRVHVYTSEDAQQSHFANSLSWVQRLHRALEQDRFCLFAQAIAPAAAPSGRFSHFEILVRLKEDGALIAPGEFIPAAERFGLMPLIDRWVVRKALEIIRRRDPHGRDTYAINLSGLTLTDESFLDYVRRELTRSGVPPSALCFELTETSAIANFDEAIVFMDTLRELGCRFALDDFGVGMSSLSYLKRLPVDFVKIDGSFVRGILDDKSDMLTIDMINKIAHLTGKKTIAEFVETYEHLLALRSIAVDFVQGFAIDHPMPFDIDVAVQENANAEILPESALVGSR